MDKSHRESQEVKQKAKTKRAIKGRQRHGGRGRVGQGGDSAQVRGGLRGTEQGSGYTSSSFPRPKLLTCTGLLAPVKQLDEKERRERGGGGGGGAGGGQGAERRRKRWGDRDVEEKIGRAHV